MESPIAIQEAAFTPVRSEEPIDAMTFCVIFCFKSSFPLSDNVEPRSPIPPSSSFETLKVQLFLDPILYSGNNDLVVAFPSVYSFSLIGVSKYSSVINLYLFQVSSSIK